MSAEHESVYKGACDASAAMRLGSTRFFVAATDEDSVLRAYDLQAPGAPAASLDVTDFLRPGDGEEADLEGAAQLGDLIFWIGSHGRNKDGIEQPSRHRLFATTIVVNGDAIEIRPVGTPYTNLLRDLLAADALSSLGLREASELAPEKENGFNIEGLAPAGDSDLLIGFRNPIPRGRAIVVRLHAPAALVRGESRAATITLAGLLDLDGRGIRAIEFLPDTGMYLLLAGAFDDSRNFRLYAWSGGPDAPVAIDLPGLDALNPEELIAISRGGGTYELKLLSDDGDALIGPKKCKKVEASQRTFRMQTFVITLPAAHVQSES